MKVWEGEQLQLDRELFNKVGNIHITVVERYNIEPCFKPVWLLCRPQFGWAGVRAVEWSPGGALLLVSGRVAVVKLGQVETGEIVVFQVRGGTAGEVRARISVRPSETTGCWYSDTFLVSSALQYLAPLTSANKEYAQTAIEPVTVINT